MKQTNKQNLFGLIENIFNFIYTQEEKNYFVNFKLFDNKIIFSIKEQIQQNTIIDLNFNGDIELYNSIINHISKLALVNNDAFGYLVTSEISGTRTIKSHNIKTKNIEVSMPIYNRAQIFNAENINSIMIDNLNKKQDKKEAIKVYTK